MTSSPPKTETYEVTLSRDEQWVVHYVLANRLDEALDADEAPPEWTVEVLETVEADGDTERLTDRQADRLYDALATYVDREETPDRDVDPGATVLGRLEDVREV
ncbi:DUF7853 family protein [Natrinema salifodinae]|uniref:Uncharacterized protein n=1 Tax=Natrinema salifodinae TaxID=1202768 RepID=A0A1I0Q849_9EURY|nr:hypothetical protein [Natrinema salifodinae]SEW22735.1 hypothetical protein SAMN05216285_3169 [Natrinema salifodinae]